MRVVVTGAAGRLGQVAVPFLRAEGYDVVATDRVAPLTSEPGFVQLDLRSDEGLADLLGGAEAVVHLATLGARGAAPAATVLADNIAMTATLLSASLAARVSKFVFASSIQVVACGEEADGPARVAYLPLDDRTPPNPTNAYGFSKLAGETLVQTLFSPQGGQGIALRFPWLAAAQPGAAWGRRLLSRNRTEARASVERGFACLSFVDAARLVDAVLRTSLPGFRTYLPAVSVAPRELIPWYVQRYYRKVPLRVPVEDLRSLIDLSRIERETGWVPLDQPIHQPPATGSFLGRLTRRLGGTR